MKKLIALETCSNRDVGRSFNRGEAFEIKDEHADLLLQSRLFVPWSKELDEKYKKVAADLKAKKDAAKPKEKKKGVK